MSTINSENMFSPKYPVQTLEKALDIIEILARESGNGVGISELSRRLDIGKSTIHRILDTLSAYGYVDQVSDKGNYRLSWRMYEIGNTLPRQRDLNDFDNEILQALCDKSQETVNLGVRDGIDVVIISKVDQQTRHLERSNTLATENRCMLPPWVKFCCLKWSRRW